MTQPDAERIADILKAAQGRKEVVALLVPRSFALGLADELFPVPQEKVFMGVPVIDAMHKREQIQAEERRGRYRKAVEEGGYIGTIFDVPMFIDADCVICTLDDGELHEYADSHGVDLCGLPIGAWVGRKKCNSMA